MSSKKCELCESTAVISPYEIPCGALELCGTCRSQIENPAEIDSDHWHCLQSSMWSERQPVQAMAYRMLTILKNESWAAELLEQMYLDDAIVEWANAGIPTIEATDSNDDVVTKDSNGTRLADGDSVTLIKDLDVKGGGFTAKRGTLVKGITLTTNPEHVEGKVNGIQIVLVAKFLKKAV